VADAQTGKRQRHHTKDRHQRTCGVSSGDEMPCSSLPSAFAYKSSLTAAFDDPPICQSLDLNGVQHRWQLVIAVARVQHPRPTGDVLAVLVG
jgi:hypothetical protein